MPRRTHPTFFDFTPPQLDVSSSDSLSFLEPLNFTMLDLNDFIAERGGDPNKIKESQRKRFAPEEAVDEVIALYEEARRGRNSTPVLIETSPNWC